MFLFFERIKKKYDISYYNRFISILLFTQIIIRFFEFFYAAHYNSVFVLDLKILTFSLIYDVFFVLFISGIIFPLYLVLNGLYIKASRWFLILFICFFILLNFLCSRYYATTLTPIDKVIFSYSFNDILTISQTEGGIYLIDVLTILFLLTVVICALALPNKWFVNKRFSKIVISFILGIAILFIPSEQYLKIKTNNKQYYPIVNKTYYFLRDIFQSDNYEYVEQGNIDKMIVLNYQSLFPEKNYVNQNYPLLFTSNNNSTLLPFFRPFDKSPNIVVIVVESLTRMYSGPNAEFGNYTPFIDSLLKQSLYWENFISTSERTVGVLPSLLGSLPHAKNGFTSMGGDMPEHLTIASILKRNGYQTNFFYGGETWFDNMNIFISRQGFDYMASGKFYNIKDKAFWGETDSVMFEKSIQYLSTKGKVPFFNIYLTLSTHGPFNFQIPSDIEDKYKLIVKNLDSQKKKEHAIQQEKVIKAFIYTDNQLKKLFNEYKKKPDFGNTIFIITGDHGIAPISQDNPLKKYHIPLLIYSELLKKPEMFKGMSSHYDLTPSLLSLLKSASNINIPQEMHWLGNQLDTSKIFTSNEKISLMELNRSMNEFVFGDLFLCQNRLYRISDKLLIKEIKNDSLLLYVQKNLSEIKLINYYCCKYNKIEPKKITEIWSNSFKLISTKRIKSIEIDSTTTYRNIVEMKINKNRGNYKFHFAFNLDASSNIVKKLPNISITATSNKTTVSSSFRPLIAKDSLTTNKITHSIITLETSIPESYKDSTLDIRVFIWNLHNATIRLDNLEIKTFKENKE